MIEIVLLLVTWYLIGILSMLWIQYWIDDGNVTERKTWPGHSPSPNIEMREILVLGICGPVVFGAILYFLIALWWISKAKE